MALDSVHMKELPLPSYLKYNGVYDLDRVYRKMIQWFLDNGWYFEETSYKHKVPSPAGGEDQILWTGWRKITEYVKYWILIEIWLFDMKEVEVVEEGQKKKMTKARMQIKFNMKLDYDYPGRFGHSWWGEFLDKVYQKYVIKKYAETIYEDELYYLVLKLQTVAKEELDMQTKTHAYYDMW